MRTSTFKANLSTPIASADEENAGIARLATRQEVLEGEDLPIIVTPQPELLLRGFRNKIINGSMDVWQRGTSFVMTEGAYTADRWAVVFSGTMLCDVTKETNDSFSMGVPYMRFEVTTADPSIDAANYWLPHHHIEGWNLKDFKDNPMSLSFWIRASKVGVVGVHLRIPDDGLGNNQTYVAPITINAANTWEYKTIENIPALSTFPSFNLYSSIASGMEVRFALAAGSSWVTANTHQWQQGVYMTDANQTNFANTLGTTIDIGNVQLEPGYACTPFEYRDVTIENLLCYRYYQKLYWYKPMLIAYVANGDARGNYKSCIIPMRATPTVSCNYSVINAIWVGASGNVLNVSWDITAEARGNTGITLSTNGAAPSSISACGGVVVGGAPHTFVFNCDAEL